MNKRQEYIEEHSEFYILGYRRLLNVLFVFLTIALLLLGGIFFQHFNRPLPKYFATTLDGRLIEIVPVKK